MQINRDKVISSFNDYVAGYDHSDTRIALKKLHTLKVAEICDEIARSLELSPEDVDLAWLIGMLHDISRFEQVTQYDTFNDAISFDHAAEGCVLLFGQQNLITHFLEEQGQDVSILDAAIRWHSAYRIPEDLDDRTKMFCNIIRDADKVDIFRVACEEPLDNVYRYTYEEIINSRISPEVLEAFYEHHAIKRELRQTMADVKVGFVALSFELVFPKSREIAIDQGYLLKIIEEDWQDEETIEQFVGVKKELLDYMY